jgi:hypothetical protein
MRKSHLLIAVASTALISACGHDPVGPAMTAGDDPSLGIVPPKDCPPKKVCDFVTFGRLITTDDEGNTIVISGNAGGNAPDGGILGEIEIHVGDATFHVHTITAYGLATDEPFSGDPNARVIIGTTDDGTVVELRLVDDPDPGQGEPGPAEGDQVYLVIDGTVILSPRPIEQGNVQLHLVCRGPGD